MHARQLRGIEPTNRSTLDQEVSLWSNKGYRIVSRSTSAVQLSKPHDSPLPWCEVLLTIILILLVFPESLLTITQAGVIFVVGTVLMATWHVCRGETLVYLTINADGEITQD
jgi:hypothetical protein